MSEGSQAFDGARIKELGWRQGSILPHELCQELEKAGDLPTLDEENVALIVVSHDCDVTNPRLDNEPCVELLLVRVAPGETADGALVHGRNPRRLQFFIEVNGVPSLAEAKPHERFFIPRKWLLGHTPDPARICAKPALEDIVPWLVKRYNRAAFPDTFNARIRKVQKPINNALSSHGQDVCEIFIGLTSLDELGPDQPYQITLWATMATEDFADTTKRQRAQIAFDIMEQKLASCAGIEIIDSTLVCQADVTLDDLSLMKRFDCYDYLSAEDEDDEQPTR